MSAGVKRAALVGLLVIPLAGCGVFDNTPSPSTVKTYEAPVGHHKTVTCLVYIGYRKGGLSCDWAHPHPAGSAR